MKVLFIIDTLEVGGAEKSLLEITSRFNQFTPVFVQLFAGTKLKKEFEKNGIEVITMNFPISYKFRYMAKKMLPIIKKISPVIIHSTLFRADMVSRHIKEYLDVPLINSLVNNSYSRQRFSKMDLLGRLKLKTIQYWDGYTASKVDLFISNSYTIKNSNSKALGIKKEKIEVIFRGRDIDKFTYADSTDIQKIKSRYRANSKKKKIFINVSRLLYRKGQKDLINAFKLYKERNEESVLLIAGEGSYRNELEKEIQNLNLKNDVFLLGNRNDIVALLKAADYFVFPSHYEGLPGALIEAMFSRIPIIASDIPENLECIQENSAFIFSVGDIEDLADKMSKITNMEDHSSLTENAFNFAINNFEINNIASKYEFVYHKMIKNENSSNNS